MEREVRDFDVEILDKAEVHALPNGWPAARVRALLADLDIDDVDDVGDDDAMEMCLMALQDLEVDEASDRVLGAVFAERMRSGVRQNLISDLMEDRPWEEFAEISQQAGIFEAVVLLQKAFPREFGKPDALSLLLRLETQSQSARRWLARREPDPGLLLRIVAGALDERAVLRRLFGQALAGHRFAEARSILWSVDRAATGEDAYDLRLISSHQWFDALPERGSFSVRAWPDVPLDEVD